MQVNQEYFLLVAEELSITNAAKKAFVTQQCMSNHIKRIEESYHTRLFNRKPVLTLTPEGERLYEHLLHIKQLEENIRSELSENNSMFHGSINVGITYSRASLIIPPLIQEYRQTFPNVEINIHTSTTSTLGTQLLNGNLDIAIRAGYIESPNITRIPLSNEQVYLGVTEQLLQKHFTGDLRKVKTRLDRHATIADFRMLPFVLNTPQEYFYSVVMEAIQKQGISLDVVFHSDSVDLRTQLVGAGYGASFFPGLMLNYIHRQNRIQPRDDNILVFTLAEEFSRYGMSAYIHKNKHQPKYLKHFVDVLQKVSLQLLPKD